MSLFEATIRVVETDVEVIGGENDVHYEQALVLHTATLAPVGPNQAILVPIGTVKVPLDKDSTDKLIKQLQENDLQR